MHTWVILFRYYPYWSIPIIIILLELGLYYRRRIRGEQWVFLVAASLMIIGILAWFIFRGDVNSAQWARMIAAD